MTGDETGLTSQLISTPSLPTMSMKGCTTPLGSTPPTLYEQQSGFFYLPQERAVRCCFSELYEQKHSVV